MSQDDGPDSGRDTFELIGLIAHDVEKLVDQHVQLLRGEFQRNIHEVPSALASIGAGVALAATGGLLGSLMLVHGLHRATRLPLWGCYGVVGGLMASLGAGLLADGSKRVANFGLVPHETISVLREDAQWLKDQVALPPTSTS